MYKSGFLDCISASAERLGLRVEFVDKANGRLMRVCSPAGRSAFFGASPIHLWPFNDALAASVVDDKELTIRLLKESGVAVPRTAIAFHDTQRWAHLSDPPPHVASFIDASPLDLPAVVKPNDSHSGRGLSFVYQAACLADAIACAARYSNGILMQEFLAGRDIRLYSFRGRGILRIERPLPGICADGKRTVREQLEKSPGKNEEARISTRSYLEQYGHVVPAEGAAIHPYPVANYAVTGHTGLMDTKLSAEEDRICKIVYEVLEIAFCAIDCILGDDDVVRVFEVNANPGIEMLYRAADNPCARNTIDYLVRQALVPCQL